MENRSSTREKAWNKVVFLSGNKGEQTPFNILRVEKVLENKSVLIPLNNTLELVN